MLTALEVQAIDLGYHDAVLLTGPDQHPAIDLYQFAGYTITATENHGDISGVRMQKFLWKQREIGLATRNQRRVGPESAIDQSTES